MKQLLGLACLAALAAGPAYGASKVAAEAGAPPVIEPVAVEERIAGASLFSLDAARMEGAFGAALNDLARHIVLETPPEPFTAGALTPKDLQVAESAVDAVTQRIVALRRRAGERARGLYRIEEALDGLEGIASKGLGLVRIRLDAGDAPVEPGIARDDETLAHSVKAADDLALTTSLTMDLRSETATLLERVQSLPRNPEDEPALPADIVAQLAERTQRLAALMDAGAIGRHPGRPANWQEAARGSLERLTADLHEAVLEPAGGPSYATVDVQLLLAFLRLQTVQADLYAKDLARFFDRTHSFPLADHWVLVAALSDAFEDLQRRRGWLDAYNGLQAAYEDEVVRTNELAADYDFKLIADYADLLPKQRSLCLQSADAADGENMVYRINAIIAFSYGMQDNFAVTSIDRGPIVREPTASRVLPDGYEPNCIDVDTGDPEGVGERLEARADEIFASMRLHLSRVEMLARHANLMKEMAMRAEAAAADLEAMQNTLKSEPRTIARYANELTCTAREGISLTGKGEAPVSLRLDADGDVSGAHVLDESKLSGTSRSFARRLRSAFVCESYDPFKIDGKPEKARKKVTVTLSN